MATTSGSRDVSVMEDDLSCNICCNLLREPKDLDCPHVFCLQCLQRWVKKGSTIECPECRHITIVPVGGLVNLKTNLRLKSMVKKYTGGVEKRESVPICPNHEGEKQHFFCVTCGVTVCRHCLVLQHQVSQHDIKELKVITVREKAELKAKMGQVEKEIANVEDDAKNVDKIERQLQAAKKKAEKDVQKRVQEVASEAKARGEEMIASIEDSYQQQMETLKEKQNLKKQMVTQLCNVHTKMQNIVDTEVDHLQQHSSLVDQMENICVNASQHDILSSDLGILQFESGSGPVSSSWFGKVITFGTRKCALKLAAEFGAFQYAQGIAVTQTGSIAVADFDADEVIIYEDINGTYKRQFSLGTSSSGASQVGQITHPSDVAVTSVGKFLVTHSERYVNIFSPSGRYEKTVAGVGRRITTTPDDMIVTGSSERRVITVHQSDGDLIRTHQVDCEFIAGIASNGKQIAFTTSFKGNSVYVIDSVTGQEVWKVEMKIPCSICYETKSNTLLVASGEKAGSFVIEQYCSTTGHLIAHLASNLYNPLSMTASKDSKIFVADQESVKVYSVE